MPRALKASAVATLDLQTPVAGQIKQRRGAQVLNFGGFAVVSHQRYNEPSDTVAVCIHTARRQTPKMISSSPNSFLPHPLVRIHPHSCNGHPKSHSPLAMVVNCQDTAGTITAGGGSFLGRKQVFQGGAGMSARNTG